MIGPGSRTIVAVADSVKATRGALPEKVSLAYVFHKREPGGCEERSAEPMRVKVSRCVWSCGSGSAAERRWRATGRWPYFFVVPLKVALG